MGKIIRKHRGDLIVLQGRLLRCTRVHRAVVWDAVQFAANGVIFVLLGEQMPSILSRAAEVVAQLTPPLAFFSSMVGLTAHRHKKTLQLLDLVFALCLHVEMRFKHVFASLRPEAFSPQIQPMIPTPGHGAWPSGHATEAFITATVLVLIFIVSCKVGILS